MGELRFAADADATTEECSPVGRGYVDGVVLVVDDGVRACPPTSGPRRGSDPS